MIPESFIQELLARIDIVDVIERYVPLKKAGANYVACCPFHNEKTPSFSVSPSKQFYHCFGCGAHGSAIGFVMEYSGTGFIDAVHELAAHTGLQVPVQKPEDRKQTEDAAPLTEIMVSAAKYYRDQLKLSVKAVDYLKGRGVSGEIAARFGLGYAPDGWQNLNAVLPDYQARALVDCGLVIQGDTGKRYDRFRGRVMFPILDQRSNVIGFGGRVIGAGEPKYLNSPETPLFEKGRELYGLPQARAAIRDADAVIVVEGYMDVVALAQHGIANCVATLGTATTPHHVHKLLRQADRVVFCFDGDSAGRKAAVRALEASLEQLADNKTVAFLFLPPEDDPDSYVRAHGADAFRKLAGQAMPLTDFLMHELKSGRDLGTAEGRSQLVHAAKPLLAKIAAPLLRLQLVKLLSEAGGLTQQEIEVICELKPMARQRAVARMPRPAPSPTEKKLLLLVVHHPEFAARIPLDLLPSGPESPSTRALRALIDRLDDGSLPQGGVGMLIERFRGTEHEPIFAELVAELKENYFDETTIEAMFADTLERLRKAQREWEFALLQKKVVSKDYSPEELLRYRELVAQKQQVKPATPS